MSNFFKLNYEGEDKVISRDERIYSDALEVEDFLVFTVTTTSNADSQKIKFYVDAIEVSDVDTAGPITFSVGSYFEMETGSRARIVNSQGVFDFDFSCDFAMTSEEGVTFECVLSVLPFESRTAKLYISNIVFEDSFFNYDKSWLNQENPDNIFDDIQGEHFLNLPLYYEEHDFLLTNDLNRPEWMNGVEAVQYLPDATDEQRGVVLLDGITLINDNGTHKVPIATNDTIGVVKTDGVTINVEEDGELSIPFATTESAGIVIPDDETIVVDDEFGTIKAVTATEDSLGIVKPDNDTITIDENGVITATPSSGLDHTIVEQDTGRKWIDGKPIYQITVENVNDTDIVLSDVDKIIHQYGFIIDDVEDLEYPFPYSQSPTYGGLFIRDVVGDVMAILKGITGSITATIEYTKI